jgi:two-component sensor histidine kinase
MTNALTHGALSVPGGRVRLRLEVAGSGLMALDWTEHGGPSAASPQDRGFGSALVAGSVSQLEGTLAEDWRPEGLHLRFAWQAEPLPAPEDGAADPSQLGMVPQAAFETA